MRKSAKGAKKEREMIRSAGLDATAAGGGGTTGVQAFQRCLSLHWMRNGCALCVALTNMLRFIDLVNMLYMLQYALLTISLNNLYHST